MYLVWSIPPPRPRSAPTIPTSHPRPSSAEVLFIPSLLHDMRHIRKLKNKVKINFGGDSDSEQLSSGSTPRTSNDSAKPDTRTAKSTGRRGLLRQDPADSPVDPHDSAATRSGPLASPHHGWPDFKKSAKGALVSILKIAEKASAPLPPLQTALGTVVASVEIYNVSRRRPMSDVYNLMAFVDRNIAQTKKRSASLTDAFAS